MNILLTGSSGFLGRHILPILKKKYKNSKIFCTNKKKHDLTKLATWEKILKKFKADYIIHLAALSGGIGVNTIKPADFFYVNSSMVSNVFEAAAKYKVKKIIYPFGGCSYPSNVKSPILEKNLWEGYPQENSAGYSIAKKIGVTAALSYKKQYNINTLLIIPGNMYGEYDNYLKDESHVIPALIRRFYEAKKKKIKKVKIWGSGEALRDFIYAKDVASNIIDLMAKSNAYNSPINISSGKKTSIKKLVYIIKKKLNYNGKIQWDISKPEGQLVKIFSTKKLSNFNKQFIPTNLDKGLEKTINWFVKEYESGSKTLRI